MSYTANGSCSTHTYKFKIMPCRLLLYNISIHYEILLQWDSSNICATQAHYTQPNKPKSSCSTDFLGDKEETRARA